MPRDADDHDAATLALMAELRELCRDVSGDPVVRSRRLAVLRRLEHRAGRGHDRSLAIA